MATTGEGDLGLRLQQTLGFETIQPLARSLASFLAGATLTRYYLIKMASKCWGIGKGISSLKNNIYKQGCASCAHFTGFMYQSTQKVTDW